MKLEVMDVGRFVEVNRLQPVTNPIFLEADGSPTAGGVFSTRIFGRPGSEDRRERWSYIDLGGLFLHPLVYKTCTQLDRGFAEIVSGARRFRLGPSGAMLAVPEDEEEGAGGPSLTGVEGLREAWGRIDWGYARPGGQRVQRTGLLAAVPTDLAFVDKWPVMPALYRDLDAGAASGGRVKEVPPINYLYVQAMTTAPSSVSGFDFADGARKRRAQETLLEIHQSCLALVASKRGIIQDRILGKYSDWAVQGVISGPTLAKAQSPAEQEVPFGSVGVPLYLLVNLFQPFILKSLDERLRAFAGGQERILLTPPGAAEPRYFELPPGARAQLNNDTYKKWIGRYMRSQENRSDPLEVEDARGAAHRIPLYDGQLGRPTTITDLLYITAAAVTANKRVMFTRYPIEDFRACHFARAAILTTEETEDRTVGGTRYPTYPLLPEGAPRGQGAAGGARWIDSIRLNNSYTDAMGADYDGDRVRMFGLFTQEANAEADRLIAAPTNFVDGQGRMSRTAKNEAVLTLYSMTA